MSSVPVERVLSRLPHHHRRESGGWSAKCPAHPGHGDTSLAIDEGDDGRVLLYCVAGCPLKQIVKALGLEMTDLFSTGNGGGPGCSRDRNHANTRTPGENQLLDNHLEAGQPPQGHDGFGSNGSNTPPFGLTLRAYSEAKKIPIETLRRFGLTTISYMGPPAVRIPYFAVDGTQAAVRIRLALEGKDRFRWKSGTKPCLYGLWRLEHARHAGYIVIVEGESDAHTLWSRDIPAMSVPGAANWREDRDAPHFDGLAKIYVVIEPDQGGEAVRKWLSQSRIRERVWLLNLGDHKDPSGLYLADPEHFCERWQAAIAAASSWSAQAEAQREQTGNDFYEQARTLLEDPDLLERIGEAMQHRGYAGDGKPPKLVYVAMTARLLERPLNLAVVAQSAAGKNRAVDEALALMPSEAVYLMKAGSPRALVYSNENFQHRVVVVAEADSIPEDGPAASAIRSIAEDDFMAYDVVEKNPRTGRLETRHIVKLGPTGLITTAMKSLGTQMGTRLLEIPIPDDPEQTRKVLKAHAQRVSYVQPQEIDATPYLALQRDLAAQAKQRVIVPYATVLADLVPAQDVRMRRDFRQLLTCIQAVALLYQRQRPRMPDGAIIATIEDYRMASELLGPIFDSIVAEGVSEAIRQTVTAIGADEETVSEATLAQRLNLSKSTVYYRVTRAIAGGWLVNHETRKGHAAKLTRGRPLPDVKPVLPTPENVAARLTEESDCSNDSIRTPAPDEPFEQDLSVKTPSQNAEVFEGSNDQRGKREPPPPHLRRRSLNGQPSLAERSSRRRFGGLRRR